MDAEHDIHALIIRTFSDEVNLSEQKMLDDWLAESDDNKKLYHELHDLWLCAGVEMNADQYDLEKAVAKFQSQIKTETQLAVSHTKLIRILKYAAVVVLCLAMPFSYYLGTKSSEKDSYTTVMCANGDKTTVMLPDSSTVCLNSGSKLMFANNFRNGSRRLFLDGEGYFSVKKDAHNPFRVKASDVEVEVLGTEFNLKAYSDGKTIAATLVTGSLKVSAPDRSVIIKPDQRAVFNRESRDLDVQEVNDMSFDIDWKDGRLSFNNQSLEDLKPVLERWFDVDIELADELVKTRRFTGTLEHESILEVITYFGHSKYVSSKIVDNKIIFYSKN